MKKVSIAILDDEIIYIHKMKELIEKYSDGREVSIQEYINSKELLESKDTYDIILLDMELKESGKNDEGLDFVKRYREKGKDALIIFVTTHDELSREGYKVKAYGYVFKDKLEHELRDNLTNAYNELDDSKSVTFSVLKEKRKEVSESRKEVMIKEIMYFETEGRHIRIHLENESFLINDTLSNMLAIFDDERFCVSHKSYVVNMHYTVGINPKWLTLCNGEKIPIGKVKRKETERIYWMYRRRRR